MNHTNNLNLLTIIVIKIMKKKKKEKEKNALFFYNLNKYRILHCIKTIVLKKLKCDPFETFSQIKIAKVF